LSPDGPWTLVDGAPGVEDPGFVYELLPKLWVFLPTEESDDDGNLFVPSPADIPIIEAYLRATVTYFEAVTSDPIDLDSAGWANHFADEGASYFDVLRAKREAGHVVDMDLGVVLRPHVIGDLRTDSYAVVFDCVLDGSVFRLPTGVLAPGSSFGVGDSPVSAPVRLTETGWLVDYISAQPNACV